MARRWTKEEEDLYRKELRELYVVQNRTIFEVAEVLGIKFQTVFDRLRRLGISTAPSRKLHYLDKRTDVKIPAEYSDDIAELFGILLGDGHISPTQVTVTLGTKEECYAHYVSYLMKKVFGPMPQISVNKREYRTVYFGSVDAVRWLQKEGLVYNKVSSQVDVPKWIFTKKSYEERFLRGFFDTDGSVYRLKHGIQLAFTNASRPMLQSLQLLCSTLGYKVSAISGICFYVTRIGDIERFFDEVAPRNEKHNRRFSNFIIAYRASRAGRPVGGGDRL